MHDGYVTEYVTGWTSIWINVYAVCDGCDGSGGGRGGMPPVEGLASMVESQIRDWPEALSYFADSRGEARRGEESRGEARSREE